MRAMNSDCRKQIIEAGRKLLHSGLTIETWGNISIRDGDRICITPSGMDYETMDENDLVMLDLNGNVIDGKRKPSIEAGLHVMIYRNRPDVSAILHTHPVSSMVFAVLHEDIPVISDEMAQALGGAVRCAAYALPGSEELAANAAKALGSSQACLLANHGAVLAGRTLKECFKNAAVLEASSEVYYKARTIGKPAEITEENVRWMRDFALHKYGQ